MIASNQGEARTRRLAGDTDLEGCADCRIQFNKGEQARCLRLRDHSRNVAWCLDLAGSARRVDLHLAWHTKDNAPVLVGSIEKHLYGFLKDRALQTPGLYFHDIGGIEDHVHLVVSVPPTLLISDWIGQMKGSSSHYINHRIANRHLLDWQTGYGVVSFETAAPRVIRLCA